MTVKVNFSPGLNAVQGSWAMKFTGKLSQCTVSNTPAGVTETISQGKITGNSHVGGVGSSLGICPPNDTEPGTNDSVNLKIVWKGTYTDATHSGKASFTNSTVTDMGFKEVTDSSGNLGLEIPQPGTEPTATGSFASAPVPPLDGHSFLYTAQNYTAIQNQCSGKHGLKKLSLTHGVYTQP